MSIRNILLTLFFPLALVLVGIPAAAEDDIPGIVVVDDEDALDNPIAFTALAEGKRLGKLESAFSCDLQDGDAECTAFTADTATGGAVVVTMLQIHQPWLLEHRGNTAFIKQKKLKVNVIVLTGAVDPDVMAEAEGLVNGCKGVARIKDRDGNDTQDKAVWSFRCKEAAMGAFLLTLEGDQAAAGMVAAQEVMDAATRKGRIRVFGKDTDGPAAVSALMQEVDNL